MKKKRLYYIIRHVHVNEIYFSRFNLFSSSRSQIGRHIKYIYIYIRVFRIVKKTKLMIKLT